MTVTEVKKEIELLTKKLAKLKAKKEGSTPEAKSIRKILRDLGHYVSRHDDREGKPKRKLSEPVKKKSKKKNK